jgi:hypothetical protein
VRARGPLAYRTPSLKLLKFAGRFPRVTLVIARYVVGVCLTLALLGCQSSGAGSGAPAAMQRAHDPFSRSDSARQENILFNFDDTNGLNPTSGVAQLQVHDNAFYGPSRRRIGRRFNDGCWAAQTRALRTRLGTLFRVERHFVVGLVGFESLWNRRDSFRLLVLRHVSRVCPSYPDLSGCDSGHSPVLISDQRGKTTSLSLDVFGRRYGDCL